MAYRRATGARRGSRPTRSVSRRARNSAPRKTTRKATGRSRSSGVHTVRLVIHQPDPASTQVARPGQSVMQRVEDTRKAQF